MVGKKGFPLIEPYARGKRTNTRKLLPMLPPFYRSSGGGGGVGMLFLGLLPTEKLNSIWKIKLTALYHTHTHTHTLQKHTG